MTSRDVPDGTWKARRKRFETLPLVSESASAYASGDRHPRNDLGRRRRRRRRRHHTRHIERSDAPSTVDRLSGPAHGRVEGATAAPAEVGDGLPELALHGLDELLRAARGSSVGVRECVWTRGRERAGEPYTTAREVTQARDRTSIHVWTCVDALSVCQPASQFVYLSACLSAESNEKRVVVVRDCLVQVQPDRILKLEFSTL